MTLLATLGLAGATSAFSFQLQTKDSSGPAAQQSKPNAYWTAPKIGNSGSLGVVAVNVKGHGVVSMYPTAAAVQGSLIVKATSWNSDGSRLTITYQAGNTELHVVVQVFATSGGVRAVLDADKPLVANVDMGRWPPALKVRQIAVPYYSTGVWYSDVTSTFMSLWWDWHTTNASKLHGTAALYQAKTDGTFNVLHEEMNLVASTDVDTVFPYPGNPPSPYIAKLAGRMVVDIWDNRFSSTEQSLEHLADYGIGNCVAIIHNWQHLGYDDGLPEHFPANPKLGGDAALKAAIEAGKADGCLMALHENYEDYYPDYPKFNGSAIALNGSGERINSWLNKGTGVQSFMTKPGWMLIHAQSQSPLIHREFGTSAGYLDEHSAVSVSTHIDMDAREAGGGKLTALLKANQSLWNFERKTHDGPVFGEGSAHWYYSGLLDGVEAQQESGFPLANSGESLPLFVDFDLTRLHPLEVDHGMGYYERWTKNRTSTLTTEQKDAYRMQEVAFGHAPFLSKNTVTNLGDAFLESNLVTPVARSYGTSQPASVAYQVNGKWANASVAAATGQFTQVEVKYKNGLVLAANAGPGALSWQGMNIPKFGWAAKDGPLLAYTAMCGNIICDYAQTTTSVFANARHSADSEPGGGYAKPAVVSVETVGDHRFTIACEWKIFRSVGNARYVAFIHFIGQSKMNGHGGAIAFQDAVQPQISVTDWKAGQTITAGPDVVTIPPSVSDGTYSIRAGLYDPSTGDRLVLSGRDDGSKRYSIGELTISGHGTQFSFTPPVAAVLDTSRMNGSNTVVNFGKVQTDGMISITERGDEWILRPFPIDRNFTVMLNARDFPVPSALKASGASEAAIKPVLKGTYWTFAMNHSTYYSWAKVERAANVTQR